MSTLDSQLKFIDLCRFFDKLITLKGQQKFESLKTFVKKCRELASNAKAQNDEADTSLFPVYRLIMPSLERERGPYGLKTKNLSLLYARVFCLGKNSVNAQKLTSYKKPINATTTTSKYDDLAERTFWLMKHRLRNDNNTVTIEQVNKFLDDVANLNEMNQNKDELFLHFTRNISATELKWLTRILLKDLKLGLLQKKIFETINNDAETMFNVTSSLYRVCQHFADLQPHDNVTTIEIELFFHVKPMLLERYRIEHIGKLFDNEQRFIYYVQTKFDGERSQIHVNNGVFKYFTRQGFDITCNPSYGKTITTDGFLTKEIAPLLDRNCRSVILDGELMGWHKLKKCFGTKGLNFDIKKVTSRSYHQPCFVAYDILLYNDVKLINKPYSERLNILKSAFNEKEGILVHCKTHTVTNVEQLTDLFNAALDKNDEGIVVKKHDCLYKPNVREKSGCYKIKAEYSDGLVQDLDLLILGGYYGHGRCSGQISVLLMGMASPSTKQSGLPSEFYAVVQVKSGLSDDYLKIIQQRLKPHWKDKKPYGVIGPRSQPPDVWIAPKQSMILQLRATEIVRTQNYPYGYSMRFPRVMKIRDDKSWYDACTTVEFSRLIKDKGVIQKLTKRKVTADDINDETYEKKPKIRKTVLATSKIYENFTTTKYFDDELTRISRLFEDKEFCVINGDTKWKKSEVEKVLLEHMAKIVANPRNETFCVIVGNSEPLKAQNLINRGNYDVANVEWLRRATRPENFAKIAEYRPWELHSASLKTKRRLDEFYDEFMDSYFVDADLDSFKRSMKLATQMLKKNSDVSALDMKEIDYELFTNGISPFSLFRGIVGYFANPNDSQKYYFAFMSGKTLEMLSSSADYIFVDVVDSNDILEEYLKELQNSNDGKSIKIINSRWIGDCFEEKKLITVDDYVA